MREHLESLEPTLRDEVMELARSELVALGLDMVRRPSTSTDGAVFGGSASAVVPTFPPVIVNSPAAAPNTGHATARYNRSPQSASGSASPRPPQIWQSTPHMRTSSSPVAVAEDDKPLPLVATAKPRLPARTSNGHVATAAARSQSNHHTSSQQAQLSWIQGADGSSRPKQSPAPTRSLVAKPSTQGTQNMKRPVMGGSVNVSMGNGRMQRSL